MGDIARLWGAAGPYVSALVDLTGTEADRRAVWRGHAARLQQAGATPEAMAVLRAELNRDPGPDSAGLAVLVAADGTSVSVASPDPLVTERIELGPLPRTAVIIDWAQRSPAHLLVDVGSDLTSALSFEADGGVVRHDLAVEPADTVSHLAELARRSDAAVIAVTGPRELVRDVASSLRTIAPFRTSVVAVQGRSDDEVAAATVRAVADDVARETVSTLRSLEFARGSNLVADGVVEVIDSLRSGAVEELVVRDDPDDRRVAWFGPHPADIAIDLEHAARTDATVRSQGPLVEVLIRSCILQGGTVRVVPAIDERRLPGGVGAALVGG